MYVFTLCVIVLLGVESILKVSSVTIFTLIIRD